MAIESFIKENLSIENEIVGKLMSKLSTLKESGRLRLSTPLRPVRRNITRWLGVVNMFERMERLLPSLLNNIRNHQQALSNFKSVTLKLESGKTTLIESHTLFQTIIDEFPNFDFQKYLGVEYSS